MEIVVEVDVVTGVNHRHMVDYLTPLIPNRGYHFNLLSTSNPFLTFNTRIESYQIPPLEGHWNPHLNDPFTLTGTLLTHTTHITTKDQLVKSLLRVSAVPQIHRFIRTRLDSPTGVTSLHLATRGILHLVILTFKMYLTILLGVMRLEGMHHRTPTMFPAIYHLKCSVTDELVTDNHHPVMG